MRAPKCIENKQLLSLLLLGDLDDRTSFITFVVKTNVVFRGFKKKTTALYLKLAGNMEITTTNTQPTKNTLFCSFIRSPQKIKNKTIFQLQIPIDVVVE